MSDENIVHLERRSPESMATYNLQEIAVLNGRVLALEKTIEEQRLRIEALEKFVRDEENYRMEQSEWPEDA